MAEWRSIETAPRDGRVSIIVATKKGKILCVEWDKDSDDWTISGTGNYYIRESYLAAWQPLPPPPSPATADTATADTEQGRG